MKQFTFIFFFSFFGLLSNGQTDGPDLKTTQKNLAKINDSLYFYRFEVTNKEYATFLNLLLRSNRAADYQSAQIDTAKWRDITVYNEPFVKYYHTHPAYANYPVVNMSFEGATLFCKWLTDQYNSNDKKKFKKVEFRLPTEKEWIAAAKGGSPTAIYPWEGNEIMTKKGLFRCNFIRAADDTMGVAGKQNDHADVTAPVNSYWPNKYGLYNMSGNVAEMIAEKGKTMGGSWLDEAEAMKIESIGKFATFDTPMPTVGFRFVMSVIEK
jgi:formylglycine-generating enzyme required for sulfatase activity